MIRKFKKIFGYFSRYFERSDLQALDACYVDEIARDIGVTASDLYRLERSGPLNLTLLPRRLEQEGIDPVVVQAEWPSVWKDLRRVCSACSSKDVCEYELKNTPGHAGWRRYCSNEHTINALDAQ